MMKRVCLGVSKRPVAAVALHCRHWHCIAGTASPCKCTIASDSSLSKWATTPFETTLVLLTLTFGVCCLLISAIGPRMRCVHPSVIALPGCSRCTPFTVELHLRHMLQ